MPSSGATPTTEPILTIAPRPPAAKRGATAAARRVSAVTLMAMMSEAASALWPRKPPHLAAPALLIERLDRRVVAQLGLDRFEIGGLGEIGAQHLDADAGLALQPLGERFEPRAVARHEHEIMAALGETVGVDRADAGRRAGDENLTWMRTWRTWRQSLCVIHDTRHVSQT